MIVAQQPHGAQHVGVALAGDEVADGEDRRALGLTQRVRRDVGAEVHDARVDRAELARPGLGARGVGEDERGGLERLGHHLAPLRPVHHGEHVAAVDGDDERDARLRPSHRVAGGRRVVGVDEIDVHAAERELQGRRRPRAPLRVGPRARRGQERDVRDLEAVEPRAQRLTQGVEQPLALGERRAARHRAVEDEHADVGAGVTRRERLAVGPHAEHGVRGARVVLGDDGHAHGVQVTWAASAADICLVSRQRYRGLTRLAVMSAVIGPALIAVLFVWNVVSLVLALLWLWALGHYQADVSFNPNLDEDWRRRWRVLLCLTPYAIVVYWLRQVRRRRAFDSP